MNLFGFIFSKEFVRTALKAIATAIVLVLMTYIFLRFYTKHGEKVELPNLVGLTLSEAAGKLSEKELGYKLIDSTYVKGMDGIIYAQIPEDSSCVKTNREIYLKVYRTIPPQKPVRFKVGEPLNIAKTKILSKGFEIETRYQPGEFNDVVLGAYHGEKELKDGDLINMGEKIKLIVSEKKATKVSLPDLKGKTIGEVKTALSEVSLNLDFPLFDDSVISSADSVMALVYKQMPEHEAGRRIRAGSTVNVWLRMPSEEVLEIPSPE